MKNSYVVSGMTCEHCCSHVAEEVRQIAGVEEVEVQLDGLMTVSSTEKIPLERIAEAVCEAGQYSIVEA